GRELRRRWIAHTKRGHAGEFHPVYIRFWAHVVRDHTTDVRWRLRRCARRSTHRHALVHPGADADSRTKVTFRVQPLEDGDNDSARKAMQLGKVSCRRQTSSRLQAAFEDCLAESLVQPALKCLLCFAIVEREFERTHSFRHVNLYWYRRANTKWLYSQYQ